jgi:Serine dehydrogenase proteinase
VPGWREILEEIGRTQPVGGQTPFDVVRRRYLGQLAHYTGRDTILYATRFIQPGMHIGEVESIIDEDVQALMDVTSGLESRNLDLVLHSPGGSAEATESIVTFLRGKYRNVRAIVPHLAMSAATMWACAANRIVMGQQSSLGPIDPQMRVRSEGGAVTMVPAQAIIDQFNLGREECRRPGALPAWVPILRQYAPALLIQCQDAIDLSEELVKAWLRKYMLARDKYSSRNALRISRALSNHQLFLSHARHIDRDWARRIGGGSVGLKVDNLESDPQLDNFVMSLYHATMQTFTAAPMVAKIIENQNGRAFVKIAGAMPVIRGPGGPAPGAPAQPGPGSPPASLPANPPQILPAQPAPSPSTPATNP